MHAEPGPGGPLAYAPLTAEELEAAATEHLPPDAAAEVLTLAQPSLRLVPTRDAGAAVGWLGGPAMMPAGAQWPTSGGRGLEVVAVLDLAALPELVGLPLPRAGWLTFFYDDAEQPWGYDPAQRDGWRVVHVVGEVEPTTAPEGTRTFPEVALAAVSEPTVPGASEEVLEAFHETAWDELYVFGEELRPIGQPVHRIGGWPDLVQDSMWLAVQLAANGIYVGGPEGYQDERVPSLTPGAAEWRLLLQIDTDDDASMMWGDAGRLYFLLRAADVAAGAFDRCWLKLQCG